jgi:hypothetical protein
LRPIGRNRTSNPERITNLEEKNVALISKIAQKTLEGKVKWRRLGTKAFASLPGDLNAEFELTTTSLLPFLRGLAPEGWRRFQVKDEQGDVLVLVENQGLLTTALQGEMAVANAVQFLFSTIAKRFERRLDQAIEDVNKM